MYSIRANIGMAADTGHGGFYVASEAERHVLFDDPSQSWTYDGIAWYAVDGS